KHRLLKTRQTESNVALVSHLSEHLVQCPSVAAFPEDADVRITQKRLQIPLFLECGVIFTQIDAGTVAKQDFVVDKPRHQFQEFARAWVRFASGKAKIDFPSR